MKKKCNQCDTEMIADLFVGVETGMYGVAIKQKRKGCLNNVSEKLHAAVYPNCGYVALYVDNPEHFKAE